VLVVVVGAVAVAVVVVVVVVPILRSPCGQAVDKHTRGARRLKTAAKRVDCSPICKVVGARPGAAARRAPPERCLRRSRRLEPITRQRERQRVWKVFRAPRDAAGRRIPPGATRPEFVGQTRVLESTHEHTFAINLFVRRGDAELADDRTHSAVPGDSRHDLCRKTR
jgi:hypothetical protein